MFVVVRELYTDDGAYIHRMTHVFVESHWQKKYEAKDQELEELKTEMRRVGETMTVMGRLLSNREVRSLAEIKKKSSQKIQTAIKVVTRYVRYTVWTKTRRKEPVAVSSWGL